MSDDDRQEIRAALRALDERTSTSYADDYEVVRSAALRHRSRRIQRACGVGTAAIMVAVVVGAVADRRGDGVQNANPTSSTAGARTSSTVAGLLPAAAVSMVGDSVMLGAEPAVKAEVAALAQGSLAIEAEVGNSVENCIQTLAGLKQKGRLGSKVVVHCGTNGPLKSEDVNRIMEVIGTRRRVAFLTVLVERTWEAPNNLVLEQVLRKYPNATVLDYGAGAKDWLPKERFFAKDGYHLTKEGSQRYATLIADWVANPEMQIPVVLTSAKGDWASDIAYDGHEVFLARQVEGEAQVVVERRSAQTGELFATIDVNQESVIGIATDRDGGVWISGGGDGAVPVTTVSKIDTTTNEVVFTTQLRGATCACPIVAGRSGVWLVGNGSQTVVRIDSDTGKVIRSIELPGGAHGATLVGERLFVGLDDSRVAILGVDSASVLRVVALDRPSLTEDRTIQGQSIILSIQKAPGAADSLWATRADGASFELSDLNGDVRATSSVIDPFVTPVAATAASGRGLWGIVNDQLVVTYPSSTQFPNELAQFDVKTKSFGSFSKVRQRLKAVTRYPGGFHRVVATQSSLWIMSGDESGQSEFLVVDPRLNNQGDGIAHREFVPSSASFVNTKRGWVLDRGDCVDAVCTTALLGTTDGGLTWTELTPPPAVVLQDRGDFPFSPTIAFADGKTGYAASRTKISITADGGITWSSVPLPGANDARSIAAMALADGVLHVVIDEQDGSPFTIHSSRVRDTIVWQRASVSLVRGIGGGPRPSIDIIGRDGEIWVTQIQRGVVNGARKHNGQWVLWDPPCLKQGGVPSLAPLTTRHLVAACNPPFGAETAPAILVESFKGGDSFAEVATPPVGVNYLHRLTAASSDALFVPGEQHLLRGTRRNGRWSWTPTLYIGVGDIAEESFASQGSGYVIVNTHDGGNRMFTSQDAGKQWQQLNFDGVTRVPRVGR